MKTPIYLFYKLKISFIFYLISSIICLFINIFINAFKFNLMKGISFIFDCIVGLR